MTRPDQVRTRLVLPAMLAILMAGSAGAEVKSLDTPPGFQAERATGVPTRSVLERSSVFGASLAGAFLPGFDRRPLARVAADADTRITDTLSGHGALQMRSKRAAAAPMPVDHSNNLFRLSF